MKLRIKVYYTSIFIFFLVFGLFKPGCFSELSDIRGGIWEVVNNIYVIWGVLDYFLILIFSFMYLKDFPIIIVPILLMRLFIIFRDIQFGVPISLDLRVLGMHLSIMLCVCVCAKLNMEYELMKVISGILAVYIVINFVTIMLFRDGFYIDHRGWKFNYFLGYKNSHIYIYFPYILSTTVADYLNCGDIKKRHMFLFLVILASTIFSNSSTDMVVITIILFGFLLVRLKRKNKLPNIICQSLISILISSVFIILNFQSFFFAAVMKFFNKNLSVLQRVRIWESAMHKVIQHPFGGNGSIDIKLLNYKIGNLTSSVQAHNTYLDIVYQGGLICLGLFVIAIFIASNRMMSCLNSKIYSYLLIVASGFFTLFLMEAHRTNVSFYLFLSVCWALPDIFYKERFI